MSLVAVIQTAAVIVSFLGGVLSFYIRKKHRRIS